VAAETRARIISERDALLAAAVPPALATLVSCADTLASAFDIVELAQLQKSKAPEIAEAWHELGQRIGLDWLARRIDELAVEGPWQAAARRDLRDSAQQLQRALMARVMASGSGSPSARVAHWVTRAGADLEGLQRTLAEMKGASAADFATLSVGVEAVRKLLR
jgi:glutamate dehydrogenase